MAYNPSNLVYGHLASAQFQGNTVIWYYTTSDTLSDIETKPNLTGQNSMGIYFNGAAASSTAIRAGDYIAVTASDGMGLYKLGFVRPTTLVTNDVNIEMNGPYATGTSVTGLFWGT